MSRPWRTTGSVERLIHAPADTIWRTVTDVTSTGERSDECQQVEWLPDSPNGAVVGARFRGRNRSGLARWSRICEIIESVHPSTFAFRTVPDRFDPSRRDSTTWRYDLTATPDGTLVRHSYNITRMPLPPFQFLYGILLNHHRDMRPAMAHTLDKLARQVETPETADRP